MDALNYCRVDVCIRDSALTEESPSHLTRDLNYEVFALGRHMFLHTGRAQDRKIRYQTAVVRLMPDQ
jgi:hypothetical protein